MKPVVIVNAKTYARTTGEGAKHLVAACERVGRKNKTHIGVALQAFDLHYALGEEYVTCYAQHADPGEAGRNTGYLLAKNLVRIGVQHVILNHSEHKLTKEVLEQTVNDCKEQNMTVIICANNAQEVQEILTLEPDYVAIEPPELIGGEISVSTARPELIGDIYAITQSSKSKLIVGAGIAGARDVHVALERGAVGVLLASHVTKAEDPAKVLNSLFE